MPHGEYMRHYRYRVQYYRRVVSESWDETRREPQIHDRCRHVARPPGKGVPPPLLTRPRMPRRILGADMPSCLRLDVGGLSKVLASRGARRSSRGVAASHRVASRRVSSTAAPTKLGNQSTVETRCRRVCIPLPAGNDSRSIPFSLFVFPLFCTFSRASPVGDSPAQVTHRSYRGAPGHPSRKTADLPENPGLPYQAARRPVKVLRTVETAISGIARSLGMRVGTRRRFAPRRSEAPADAEKRARFTG